MGVEAEIKRRGYRDGEGNGAKGAIYGSDGTTMGQEGEL